MVFGGSPRRAMVCLAIVGVACACGRSSLWVPEGTDGEAAATGSGDDAMPDFDAAAASGDGTVRDARAPDAASDVASDVASDAVADVAAPDTALEGVTAISVGLGFACALLSGGSVQCWGANGAGQLGDGTMTASSTPVAVSGLSGATAISAGDHLACALLPDGSVRCWGSLAYGALPGSPAMGCIGTPCSPIPVVIPGLSGVTAISTGLQFACALLSNGTVQCWGDIPDGSPGASAMPPSSTPVAVGGLSGATAIAASRYFPFACALLADHTVRCWGHNFLGELGNGTMVNSSTPVLVSGLSGVTAISVEEGGACALLSGGTVQCWGLNLVGNLGSGVARGPQSCGANGCSLTPVAVSGLRGVTALSTGGGCALLSGGSVRCWGGNAYGQLGDGTTTDSPTPVAVSGLGGVTAVSSSASFSCALRSDGAVECWGIGGALGNGTDTGSSSPVFVVR